MLCCGRLPFTGVASLPASRQRPRRAQRLPQPARAGVLDSVLEAAAAANAEAIARREGADLVGKKRGLTALQSLPAAVTAAKPEACARILELTGCLQARLPTPTPDTRRCTPLGLVIFPP